MVVRAKEESQVSRLPLLEPTTSEPPILQISMAPCVLCPPSNPARAILRRPKNAQPVCKECFFEVFETEIHNTIMGEGQAESRGSSSGKNVWKLEDGLELEKEMPEKESCGHAREKVDLKGKGKQLFRRGERVAIGASGGKGAYSRISAMRTLRSREVVGRSSGDAFLTTFFFDSFGRHRFNSFSAYYDLTERAV